MREAYRLEKHIVSEFPAAGVHNDRQTGVIALLYRGRKEAIPVLAQFRTEVRQLLMTFATGKPKQPHDGCEGR